MRLFRRNETMRGDHHAGGHCAEGLMQRRFAFGGRRGPDGVHHGHDGPGHDGPGHGGRGHGHGRFRGGRLRRLLEHGDLRLLVLHLIAEKPRHGYEIIKAIEDLAGGAYAPSPGVVYPTLAMLEDLGQVTGTTEGSRKSFTLTAEGTEALTANRKAVDTILERIGQEQAHEPALPVIRAMENLKTALRLKRGSGAISPAVAREIAALIDQAARSIEEL
ncbi:MULTISPECIES: PadR family transcriptional regulator [Acidiphilium]|uniref:PadR family transcriptional regulator n=1 Tax=Acidiphilium TaxID=522 RepID=UPI00257FA246|nr:MULTISPECIES: PadR family transcriptional regulator [Acidiphilium]HQT85756.1 PadR family transcriptional regulator [Acidiphilium rubrum]